MKKPIRVGNAINYNFFPRVWNNFTWSFSDKLGYNLMWGIREIVINDLRNKLLINIGNKTSDNLKGIKYEKAN